MKNITKKKKWLAVGAVLLTVVIVGIVLFSLESSRNAASQTIEAVNVMSEQTTEIVAWGEVKYGVVYDISIDFPSTVVGLSIKEGDHVTMGQTLATIDMSEYQTSVDKLEQQLMINEAGLKTVTQDTSALKANIAQLQNDISRKTNELNNGTNANLKILQDSLALAQKEVENAKQDVANYQQLYDAGAVSQEVLNQYNDLLNQKEKAVSDIENNIEKLKSDLQTELDGLKLSLKSYQVQLSQAENANSANSEKQNSSIAVSQVDLDNMKNKSVKDYLNGNQIISFVDNGIVQNIKVIYGTRLGTQNVPTSVMQLIDVDSIVISAEVDEEFIKNVSLGEDVKIVPEFDNTLSLSGTVTQISNIAVEKDGKRIVKVEIKPQDPDGLLKPGFTADVYFPAEQH